MAKKYIMARIELEDYNKMKAKKENLERDINNILRKNVSFPMTTFFKAIANGTIEVNPAHTIQYFKVMRVKK